MLVSPLLTLCDPGPWDISTENCQLLNTLVTLCAFIKHHGSLWTYGVHRLVGLVVKASASGAEYPEFDSHLRLGYFFVSSDTSDVKIGTPVATLPGAWRYRVSAVTL